MEIDRQLTCTTIESRDSFVPMDPVEETALAPSPVPTRSINIGITNLPKKSNKYTNLVEGKSKRTCKLTLMGTEDQVATFGNYRMLKNPVKIDTLIEIVEENPDLVCLELFKIRLKGDLEAYTQLANTIERHGMLQAFSMERCRILPTATDPHLSFALDPVVAALSRGRFLRDLTLIADGNGAMGSLSVSPLYLLGQSSSLRSLRLCHMDMDSTHMTTLWEALRFNEMLRTLKLSLHLCEHGTLAIQSLLAHNKSLESVEIVLESVQAEISVLHLARALQAADWLKYSDLVLPKEQEMTSTLHQALVEFKVGKELAREMAWTSTNVSNCPFIRLFYKVVDYCIDEFCS